MYYYVQRNDGLSYLTPNPAEPHEVDEDAAMSSTKAQVSVDNNRVTESLASTGIVFVFDMCFGQMFEHLPD